MSGREEDLRKSLKALYDDLCDAENKQEKEPFGFKNRLKVIHENLEDLGWKLATEFTHLGEFGALRDFESGYYQLGDSGMDQELKSHIKLLAAQIDLDLEQSTHTTKPNDTSLKKHTKHKWTRGEKLALAGIIVLILSTVVGFLI